MKTTLRLASALIAACTLALGASAQTMDAKKTKINDIKKSSDYLYCDVTMADRGEALATVEEMLEQTVNEYVAQQKKRFQSSESIVTLNRNYCIDTLSMKRGNMFRAFAYVKKNDILGGKNVTVNGNRQQAQSSQPQPALSPARQAVYGRLKALERFDQLEAAVKELQSRGHVADYGKYAQVDNPEKYVLVIYDREGRLRAILSDGAQRTNLRTGQSDTVANYAGCGAIALRVKD